MSHLESEIILAVFARLAVVPCAVMHVSQHIPLLTPNMNGRAPPPPPSFSPWGPPLSYSCYLCLSCVGTRC